MAFDELIAAADRAVLGHLGGVSVIYAPEVYSPGGGAPVTVQGLFDANFTLFTNEGEIRGPAVFLRLEDLPTNPDEDNPVLTIGDKCYRVRARQLDGLGGVHLVLSW